MKWMITCLLVLAGMPAVLAQKGTDSTGKGSTIRRDTTIVINSHRDTTQADTTKKTVKPPYVHQFRVGIDVARIVYNFMYSDRKAYELQFDYALRKGNYLVAEAGWGKNNVDFETLKYSNSGEYLRLGIDKNVLTILNDHDFDIFFIGLRYGMAIGKVSEATFLVPSYYGPSIEGTTPGSNYFIHWGEITAGLRVELLKDLFVGWNIRLKFLLNSGEFSELAPSYVPGYGKGDKTTNFDGNFYISYALRWGGK